MFTWWGRVVVRLRWWVLAATAAVVVLGGVWGTGVFGSLTGGGFNDPNAPSSVALDKINAEFGRQGGDVLVLYSSQNSTVDSPAFADPVKSTLDSVRQRPEVKRLVSYYDTQSPALISKDGHATYAAIELTHGDDPDAAMAELKTLRPALQVPGVTTQVGGFVAFVSDANKQIEHDIQQAETFTLPILLILMIFIFRGLVAALTPLLVGVLAILGAFIVTRVLTQFTDVSVFAINVITMLGLGMGIDYALFVVSRFREELRRGRSPADAVAATIATAGRTVMISGITVALALASLLIFPLGFLRSMGAGGVAAVLVAMLAALTALPALLAVLGDRINAGRVRLRRARPAEAAALTHDGGWARLARSVMRRPVVYLVVIMIVLGGLATPFLRATFGGFDERVLPEGTQSRTVSQLVAEDFPGGGVAPITVLLTNTTPADASAYAGQLAELPNAGAATVTATKDSSALITVTYPAEPTSTAARDLVTAIRTAPTPPGSQSYVAGRPANDVDQLRSLGGKLPLQALIVAVMTFLLLFFAFGSVVLPVKAILMNIISIGASFGVVVWVFQDGHLQNLLGFTSVGYLEPTNLILMLAILFGLSTDYEVFLLSRVREEWDATGDNRHAVAAGLQRTGGIITAAALLLIIVIGGFATGGAATIKMLGVGTLVAVAVDAALVRTLLVPATMRLLGRWNWWAPGPLARVYRRYGLRETGEPGVAAQAPRPQEATVG
jgi:RND superfamily putative drug exporter